MFEPSLLKRAIDLAVAVPLAVVAAPVCAVLLALVAVESPGSPLLVQRRPLPDRPVYVENFRYLSEDGTRTRDMKAVIHGDHKLIVDRKRGVVRIFDLRRDPHERTNLVATEPRLHRRLAALLDAFVSRVERATPLP